MAQTRKAERCQKTGGIRLQAMQNTSGSSSAGINRIKFAGLVTISAHPQRTPGEAEFKRCG